MITYTRAVKEKKQRELAAWVISGDPQGKIPEILNDLANRIQSALVMYADWLHPKITGSVSYTTIPPVTGKRISYTLPVTVCDRQSIPHEWREIAATPARSLEPTAIVFLAERCVQCDLIRRFFQQIQYEYEERP